MSFDPMDDAKRQQGTETPHSAPLITLVSAFYNVSAYLDDFFASLEAQSCGLDAIAMVFVDDGSTDDSLQRLHSFAALHPNVTVVHKENGGQASARNRGLEEVRSEWVTFPDPDDLFNDTYFESVLRECQSVPADVPLLATRAVVYNESTDRLSDSHPLAHRWRRGVRTIELGTEPRSPHLMVNVSAFRVSAIAAASLRFNEKLRVRFEDGSFVCRYLALFPEHRYRLVAGAEYLYRRRADNSSSVQNAMSNESMYASIVREGYIPVLDSFEGKPPTWVQMAVIYDLFWILKADHNSTVPAIDAECAQSFLGDLRLMLERIDSSNIWAFNMLYIPTVLRRKLFLLHPDAPTTFAHEVVDYFDERELAHVTYWATSDHTLTILAGGEPVEARHEKRQLIDFYGLPAAEVRHLWVSTRQTFSVEIDGVPVTALPGPGGEEQNPDTGNGYKLLWTDLPEEDRKALGAEPEAHSTFLPRCNFSVIPAAAEYGKPPTLRKRLKKMKPRVKRNVVSGLMSLRRGTWPYGGAWVFMDRAKEAADSAEELYGWVRRERPEIKARFVLDRRSKDYRRLRKLGVKVVPFRSVRHYLLMLQGKYLISSHADRDQYQPYPMNPFGVPPIRRVFLQHGVIKDDISGWLNPKPIDLFLASTEAEYKDVIKDGPYAFSTAEVRLIGLPRYDALRRLDVEAQEAGAAQNILLIAPTWRRYLDGESDVDWFLETEYAKNWGELLASSELRSIAAEHGLRVLFMPHPKLARYLSLFDVPEFVEVVGYDDVDIQTVVATSAAMITDYSSIAFNLAYLERPVAYFQFDPEEFYAGHTGAPGYYDYERDGFGPVSENSTLLLSRLTSVLAGGPESEQYYRRMREAFPVKDGKNSERAYEAIMDLERAVPSEVAYQKFVGENWALTEPGDSRLPAELGREDA